MFVLLISHLAGPVQIVGGCTWVRRIHGTFHFLTQLWKKTENCSMYTNQAMMFTCKQKNHIWDTKVHVNAVRKLIFQPLLVKIPTSVQVCAIRFTRVL